MLLLCEQSVNHIHLKEDVLLSLIRCTWDVWKMETATSRAKYTILGYVRFFLRILSEVRFYLHEMLSLMT